MPYRIMYSLALNNLFLIYLINFIWLIIHTVLNFVEELSKLKFLLYELSLVNLMIKTSDTKQTRCNTKLHS